jgi:hypothetical protein
VLLGHDQGGSRLEEKKGLGETAGREGGLCWASGREGKRLEWASAEEMIKGEKWVG